MDIYGPYWIDKWISHEAWSLKNNAGTTAFDIGD